jgi:hypothetical protein
MAGITMNESSLSNGPPPFESHPLGATDL